MSAKHVMHKYRVGVLMGGRSIEREVSLNSGRTICDHLDTNKYDIIPLFQDEDGQIYLLPWRFLHRGKIADFQSRLDGEAQRLTWDALKEAVDFVYIAVHGRYGEDGTLQGMLEILGIPYLGAKVLGSALAMDKAFQKEVLNVHNIRVPAGVVVKASEMQNITSQQVIERLSAVNVSFPYIVKPAHEGSSLGISVSHDATDLLSAIHAASRADNSYVQDVIVEEKVDGLEFVCVSLQKHQDAYNPVTGTGQDEWFSFPITEVVKESDSEFYDYDQKYMPGRALKITPARCSKKDQAKIIDVCEQVAKVLGLATISRTDGFLTKDGEVVIIDPNSLTGMGPATFLFHQAAEVGMSHTQLINFLIEHELARYGLATVIGKKESGAGMSGVNGSDVKKIRVAVLLGGDTNEREISLESGRNVCYKLSPEKYDVTPVFVKHDMKLFKLTQKYLIKNSTGIIAELVSELPDSALEWADLPKNYDFVFIALHGGKGEGGAVQGALEMLGLPYNGSGVLASALCMDKNKTNTFLRAKGFDVPQSILISKSILSKKTEQEQEAYLSERLSGVLNFPLVVKPHDDGCSMFVQKVQNTQELIAACNAIFDAGKSVAMLEELIIGMELTCGAYGNDIVTVLPPSQAVAQAGVLSIREKFLPGAGSNITPAPLGEEQISLVQDAIGGVYKTIDCKGYVRIDCFYQSALESPTGKQRVVILEINSLPALTPATCLFHQAAEVGIRPMEFIDIIVQLGFQNHAKKDIAPVQNININAPETSVIIDEREKQSVIG
ncbi:MAG: hypothetical protein ABH827_01140 [bacterium]